MTHSNYGAAQCELYLSSTDRIVIEVLQYDYSVSEHALLLPEHSEGPGTTSTIIIVCM